MGSACSGAFSLADGGHLDGLSQGLLILISGWFQRLDDDRHGRFNGRTDQVTCKR